MTNLQPYYIGLDPSMSGFGLAIIDKNSQEIILDEFKADDHHNFILMCWSIENMYNDFISKYNNYVYSDTYIAQELPISAGINSGKLNALGMFFYYRLGSLSKYERIRVYHPIKLKVFHHKKKYDKWDTIKVVEDLLEMFKEIGYSVNIRVSRTKKKVAITNNEADAMMYAIKTYLDRNPNSEISKAIMIKYPRFNMLISLNEEKCI